MHCSGSVKILRGISLGMRRRALYTRSCSSYRRRSGGDSAAISDLLRLPGKISVPAGRMSRDRDDVLLFGEEDRGTPMSEKVDEGVVGAEEGPLEGIGKDETRMKVWSRVVIVVFAVGVEGERMVR